MHATKSIQTKNTTIYLYMEMFDQRCTKMAVNRLLHKRLHVFVSTAFSSSFTTMVVFYSLWLQELPKMNTKTIYKIWKNTVLAILFKQADKSSNCTLKNTYFIYNLYKYLL